MKNETAMLTTFNEVDMSAIMNLRSLYKQDFIDKLLKLSNRKLISSLISKINNNFNC